MREDNSRFGHHQPIREPNTDLLKSRAVIPVEGQDEKTLIWGTDDFPRSYGGPDLVIYGHRDNAVVDREGWPLPSFSGCAIGIDTISHGVLTAIALPERRLIQSGCHVG